MPLEFQPIDIPFGQGMDDNTARTALPSGQAKSIVNGYFIKAGAISKRPGFSTQLGTALGSQTELYNYGSKLLAAQGGDLYDYSPTNATSAFVNRGSLRAVPTTSITTLSANTNISECDSYSAGGYTITAWYDGTATHAQISDDASGVVVSVDSATSSIGTGAGYLQCYGVVQSGVVYLGYAVAPPGGTLFLRTAASANSGFTWATTTANSGATGVAGFNIQPFTDPSDATAPFLLTFIFGAQHVQWGFCRPTTMGTQQDGGTYSLTGTSAANTPLGVLFVPGSPGFIVVAYNCNTPTPTLALTSANFTTPNVNNATWTPSSAATAQAGHLALINNGALNYTLYYDVSALIGTSLSYISSVEFNGAYGGPVSGPTVWKRSASLSSFWLNGYAAITYASLVTASTSAIAAAAYPGLASASTVNSALLLVDTSGNVVSRVFRDAALSMTGTATLSADLNGSLVVSTRVLSKAEAATINSALALAGVGQVRLKLASEYSSTSGAGSAGIAVTAFRDSITVGGSPCVYDGLAPVEENFHVYPEAVVNFPGIASALPATALTRSQTLTSGQFVSGLGQSGFTSGTNASSGAGGHLLLVVAPGITASTTPTYSVGGASAPYTTGGKTTDGTAVLLDLGVTAPRIFGGVVSASVFAIGSVWVPSTGPNGLVYVVTANNATLASEPITEPVWSSPFGTSCTGAGLASGAVTFLAAAPYNILTQNTGYTYQFCYTWVDAQGQLHRSAASVPVGGQFSSDTNGPNANTAVAVTTCRITAKTQVRIEAYRTSGNGTVCQLIAIIANDPTTDYVGFVDTIPDTTQESGAVLYQGSLGAGGLANRPPPSCTAMAVFGTRVYANNLENPYELRPSQLITDGFGASWADELPIQLNGVLGRLNALIQMDGYLILFQDYAISYLTGDGPDNTGANGAFASPVPIATDVGCVNPASCLVTPAGILFQSPKGIYLLGRDLSTSFVGEQVLNAVGTNVVTDVQVDPSLHQALFVLSNNTLLVFDYSRGAWAEWIITTSLPYSLGYYGSSVVVADTTGNVLMETPNSYTDALGNYALAVELAAEKLGGMLTNAKVRGGELIVDAGAATTLLVSTANNYIGTGSATYVADNAPQTVLGNAQIVEFRLPPPIRMSALGVLVQEIEPGAGSLVLLGLTIFVGVEGGLYRVPPSKRSY